MTNIVKLGTIGMAAVLLAGCQSSPFSGWGFAKQKKARVAMEAPPEIIGAQLIEEGRAQLRQGRISAAVATFRLAKLDPSVVAQAENGLGVAYAKLGRFDLADRYFRAAVSRDPQDMRFTANLLRLQRHVMLARASAAPVERVAAAPEPKAEADPKLARAHRISDGIVRITTREDLGERPQVAIAYREKPSAKTPEATPADAASQAPDAVAATDAPQVREKLVVLQK